MRTPILLFALLIPFVQSLLAQDVIIISEWGNDGYVNIPTANFNPLGFATTSNNEVYVMGWRLVEEEYDEDTGIGGDDVPTGNVWKYTSQGNFDMDFGSAYHPILWHPAWPWLEEYRFVDAIEFPDGKVRCGGSLTNSGPGISSVQIQFNPDGSYDDDYGENVNYGGQTTSQGIQDYIRGYDGVFFQISTFFAGSILPEVIIGGNWAGGSFGYDSNARAFDSYVSPDNDFYLAMGLDGENFDYLKASVVKFTEGGLDPDFGEGGIFQYQSEIAYTVYQDVAGSDQEFIMASGRIGSTPIITKLNKTTGVPIQDFGDNGHILLEDVDVGYGKVGVFDVGEGVYLVLITEPDEDSYFLALDESGEFIEDFGNEGVLWVSDFLTMSDVGKMEKMDDGTFIIANSDFTSLARVLFDVEPPGFTSGKALSSSELRYYESNDKTIALEVQSATFDGDSVLIPHNNWFLQDQLCYLPEHSSIAGSEIRISEDGLHRIVTGRNDTLTINITAELNSPWIAYSSQDESQFVEATIVDEDYELILGTVDFVRTIHFQMLDEEMNPIDAPVNNWAIKFGLSSGLVRFPDFSHFPDFVEMEIGTGPMFDLVGRDDAGVQDVTRFDIYDFQVGDEIHIEEATTSGMDINLLQMAEKVLERTDYADSIVYEMEIRRWSYSGPSLEADPQPLDTLYETRVIEADSLFDLPAGRSLVNPLNNTGTFNWLEESNLGWTKNYIYNDPIYEFDEELDPCFMQAIDFGCGAQTSTYIVGLGGPYSYCMQSEKSTTWRELRYFNLSGDEWGEPLSVRNHFTDLKKIKLYPNPVNDFVRVEIDNASQNLSYSIISLSGQKITSGSVNQNQIDLSDLDQGLYVFLLLEDGEPAGRARFVKL